MRFRWMFVSSYEAEIAELKRRLEASPAGDTTTTDRLREIDVKLEALRHTGDVPDPRDWGPDYLADVTWLRKLVAA